MRRSLACPARLPVLGPQRPAPGTRTTTHGSRITALGPRITVLIAALLALPGAATAQSTAPDSIRSTRAGVYTEVQSAKGREIYALNCMSCHTPASHAGPEFAAKWDGRLFWDLFEYVRESMPKSEPGSLTAREYLAVLAYMLKINNMPGGPDELPSDSISLARIRIEFKPARDTSAKR